MRRRRGTCRSPGAECRKSRGDFIDGKEESYERDPGRVPFVFNKKVFRTFKKVLKTCSACRKDVFDRLAAGGPVGPPAVSCRCPQSSTVTVVAVVNEPPAAPLSSATW